MADDRKAISGLTLTVLLAGAGLLAREATAGAWSVAARKSPPTEESNGDVDIKEAIAWALISGAAVGLARLVVRRGLAFPGTPIKNNENAPKALTH